VRTLRRELEAMMRTAGVAVTEENFHVFVHYLHDHQESGVEGPKAICTASALRTPSPLTDTELGQLP
jgi:hypothetical protein